MNRYHPCVAHCRDRTEDFCYRSNGFPDALQPHLKFEPYPK